MSRLKLDNRAELSATFLSIFTVLILIGAAGVVLSWSSTAPGAADVTHSEASYIIFKDDFGRTCAKNGTSGRIDFSSTNDSGVFQNAIDTLALSSGGKIQVMPGSYEISWTILHRTNVEIDGCGNSTQFKAVGADPIIDFDIANVGVEEKDFNQIIRNIAFNGNQENGTCVRLGDPSLSEPGWNPGSHHGDMSLIEDCQFFDAGTGVQLYRAFWVSINRVYTWNCSIGLNISGCYQLEVANTRITGVWTGTAGNIGIADRYDSYDLFRNLDISSCAVAVLANASTIQLINCYGEANTIGTYNEASSMGWFVQYLALASKWGWKQSGETTYDVGSNIRYLEVQANGITMANWDILYGRNATGVQIRLMYMSNTNELVFGADASDILIKSKGPTYVWNITAYGYLTLPVYTNATRPAGVAGSVIYVSDGGTGWKVQVYSGGWIGMG